MVEGLTFFSSPTKGSCQLGPERFHRVSATEGRDTAGIEFDLTSFRRQATPAAPITSSLEHTHEILVTLAERPHPFPSRTRQ